MINTINLEDILDLEVISSRPGRVHLFWWVFWLMCPPSLLIVLLVHLGKGPLFKVKLFLKGDKILMLEDYTDADMVWLETIVEINKRDYVD